LPSCITTSSRSTEFNCNTFDETRKGEEDNKKGKDNEGSSDSEVETRRAEEDDKKGKDNEGSSDSEVADVGCNMRPAEWLADVIT
jgi:hypothetical protein